MKLALIMSSMYKLDDVKYFKLNINSINTYCNKWDIEFIFLDPDSPFCSNIKNNIGPSHKLAPHITKILRLNALLNTDADYGIFVDLDTNIINLHGNIRDFIKDGNQYFSLVEPISNFIDRSLNKLDFCKFLLGNKATKDNFRYINTGFSILSRNFCQSYMEFANDYQIDIYHKSHIDNLVRYESYNNSQQIDDEFLLESFLIFSKINNIQYNLISLRDNIPNHIILDSYCWDNITLEKIVEYYPIFFHNGNIGGFIEKQRNVQTLQNIKHYHPDKDPYNFYNILRHTRYAEMFEKKIC